MNAHEIVARMHKANLIADVLAEAVTPTDPVAAAAFEAAGIGLPSVAALIPELPAQARRDWEDTAGVNGPASDLTWEWVAAELQRRAKVARKAAVPA